jgi:hypothetical protein
MSRVDKVAEACGRSLKRSSDPHRLVFVADIRSRYPYSLATAVVAMYPTHGELSIATLYTRRLFLSEHPHDILVKF